MPILGPMEIKNYIIVLFPMFLPTHRFQNFLRIENRTIISRDKASFVQKGQVLHNCYKNKHSKYVCLLFFLTDLTTGNHGNRKINACPSNFYFILFFRPTDFTKKAPEKSAIQ